MTWSLPAAVEDALWEAARAELPPAALEPRALAAAVVARSHRYTDEREQLGTPLPSPERARDLAARALFFGVADATKIQIPLAELAARDLVGSGPLRLLDIGAGAGAMTLGALAAFPGRVATVHAVDQDAGALAILRRAVARFAPEVAVDARAGDALALPDRPFDLIVAGTVVNELPAARRLGLVTAAVARLAPGGALIILEPALRHTARDLHQLRDAVVAAGLAHVFAPCTRQSTCPALADERDWCHEDRSFTPPPRLRELSMRTGLRDGGLKFAYLTLRREADPLVADLGDRRALRVVSGPLDSKGNVARLVCGVDGRQRLRVLTRERGTSLRTLTSSRRGDVLLARPKDPTTEPTAELEPGLVVSPSSLRMSPA